MPVIEEPASEKEAEKRRKGRLIESKKAMLPDEGEGHSDDDEGSGMPAEQRAIMLEPFSRLEASRNRGTGGAGLGLAIVRTLAEAHGGEIQICDGPKGGRRTILSLPIFHQ